MEVGLIILGIAVVILAALVMALFIQEKEEHKDLPKLMANYLFAYSIKEDTSNMPTEFLVNWKLSALENHLYLLQITLEDDLDVLGYLKESWVKGYDGRVYINVYKVEGMLEIRHIDLGKYEVYGREVKAVG